MESALSTDCSELYMSYITIITISRFSFCFLLLSIMAAVPKVSTIDTVVAMSDSRNCFSVAIPLPAFRLLGVCSLMFIIVDESLSLGQRYRLFLKNARRKDNKWQNKMEERGIFCNFAARKKKGKKKNVVTSGIPLGDAAGIL